jgi:serine/threonine-protein kinase
MVHRDVKPGNILLDREGTAYIADFGLAKITDGTNLTEAGQSVGSMDYVAPEQIRGEQVTGAADTYSLGCVVFECVQGHPPFAHLQGIRVLWGHMQDEPPELSADRTDIPPGFAQALKSALRKDPAERPASSIEFARSLGQAAGVPTALAER